MNGVRIAALCMAAIIIVAGSAFEVRASRQRPADACAAGQKNAEETCMDKIVDESWFAGDFSYPETERPRDSAFCYGVARAAYEACKSFGH